MKTPEITTTHELFETGARYKAPVFQRLYVWGRKEIETLQDDIDTADPKTGQFLGALVLKDMGRPAGPASPTSYLIIDGQQRLTTLYLLLLALANTAAEHGDSASATFIWQTYLAEVKTPAYKGWPKLVPTLQDRYTFWSLLEGALPSVGWNFTADPPEGKPHPAKALAAQWKRALQYVEHACLDASGTLVRESYDRILLSIQEYLRFICIPLEADDDANATFNRLNAKGVPLELADLVRNEVFSKFTPMESEKADRFFLRSWQPFERLFPEATLSAFFPVFAYIVLRGKVTKAAAFHELQKRWKKLRPPAILLELTKYAPYFVSLSTYTKHTRLSRDVNSQIERFSRMPRTRVTWPFLIESIRAVAEGRLDERVALRSLRIVEAFLVRRALVGREPTGLHAVFKVLWDKTKGDPARVIEKIVTRTIQTPDDAELKKSLSTDRSDTRVILKYVLEEYERAFIRKRKYDPPPVHAATTEHVLPQHLTTAWRKYFTPQQHEAYVGLIGNLAALSEMQNKSLKDQPWSEKSRRFRGSNFKTTQELAKHKAWGPGEIDARTAEICGWVVETWPELEKI